MYIVSTTVEGTSYYRIYSDGFIEQAGYITDFVKNSTITIDTKVKTPFYANVRCCTTSGGDDNDYGAACYASSYKLICNFNFERIYWPQWASQMYWTVRGFV